MDYKPLTVEEIQTKALFYGCTAVFATDQELFVDIDTGALCVAPVALAHLMGKLNATDKNILYTRSKSKRLHCYLRLIVPQSRDLRIFYQACLGSDPVREMVAFRYEGDPISLFETPDQLLLVNQWRASF